MGKPSPLVPVGYDYRHAMLRVAQHYTYEQIAAYLGYDNVSSVGRIASGTTIPSHPVGEALFAIYLELFKEKPPYQAHEIANLQCMLMST